MPLAKLFGLDEVQLDPVRRAAVFLVLVWVLGWFVLGSTDALVFSGVDLRDKVVAGRAWALGLDPYLFPWSADMPHAEELLDASRRVPGPSRSTYAPTVILFYRLTAWLPYATQRLTWWWAEWVALMVAVALLLRTVPRPTPRWDLLVVALGAFAGSYVWRLHAERGQYYVFLVLCEAVGLWALTRREERAVHGVAWGLAMALRPTTVVLVPFLWLAGRGRTALAALATAGVGVGLTVVVGLGPAWASFLENARMWEAWVHDPFHLLDVYGPKIEGPHEGEGMPLDRQLYLGTFNTSAMNVLRRLDLGLEVTRALVRGVALGWGLLWLGLAVARRRLASPRAVMAAGLLAVVGAGFCVPIRWGYVDVMWLPLIAAVWPELNRPGSRGAWWVFVAACVIGVGHPLPPALIAPLHALRELLFLGVMTWATARALHRSAEAG